LTTSTTSTTSSSPAAPSLPLLQAMLPDAFPPNVSVAEYAGGANVLSMAWHTSGVATLLGAKTGDKLRLQGSSLPALATLADALFVRVHPSLPLHTTDPVPLAEFFEVVDAHIAARKELCARNLLLEQALRMQRAVVKRLLVRYREKQPAAMDSLSLLAQQGHEDAQRLNVQCREAQENCEVLMGAVLAATTTLQCLIIWRTGCDSATSAALQTYLAAEPSSQWEEDTDAGITLMLRLLMRKPLTSSESRSAAGQVSGMGPQTLAPPENSAKLRKHLTLLVDKLAKGASVAEA